MFPLLTTRHHIMLKRITVAFHTGWSKWALCRLSDQLQINQVEGGFVFSVYFKQPFASSFRTRSRA
jgi:hypothetical protein